MAGATIRLERWRGPWAPDDPDADLKCDVAIYCLEDPLVTVTNLGRRTGIPVGALVRYVLCRWAGVPDEGLLGRGVHLIERLRSACATGDGDVDRLAAYGRLCSIVGWLRLPLVGAVRYPEDMPSETRTDEAEPVVELAKWTGPWPADDADANFKLDVAATAGDDPRRGVDEVARRIGVPVGAIVRAVLARWASEGSAALVELGPARIERMWAACEAAEAAGGDAARLAALATMCEVLAGHEEAIANYATRARPPGADDRARRLR